MTWKTRIEKAERIVPLVSHVAQVGLFFVTAWGLFYTVIPLYQKAAVDEQVAKQEAALTQLSTRLNDSYAKLRRQSVIEFEFFAGYACTGLGTPPADYAKAGKDPYSEALNIDIRACLYQQLMQFPPLYELTKEDRGLLVLELDRIGKELNIIRLSTIAEVDKLRAAHPLKGPIALGPDYMFWLGLMKQSGASEREFVEMQKLMSFNYQRDILVEPYLRKVRDGIASLSRINWAPPAAPK